MCVCMFLYIFKMNKIRKWIFIASNAYKCTDKSTSTELTYDRDRLIRLFSNGVDCDFQTSTADDREHFNYYLKKS